MGSFCTSFHMTSFVAIEHGSTAFKICDRAELQESYQRRFSYGLNLNLKRKTQIASPDLSGSYNSHLETPKTAKP